MEGYSASEDVLLVNGVVGVNILMNLFLLLGRNLIQCVHANVVYIFFMQSINFNFELMVCMQLGENDKGFVNAL